MSDEIDTRPYTLRTVVIDDGEERPLQAYSNMEENAVREWPIFTREQLPALLESTVREHFQPIWIEAIQNYAVVTGYNSSLPVPFDLGPFMEKVALHEEVDDYQDGKGFNIAYAKKHEFAIDGQIVEGFSFDSVDYFFCKALEPKRAPIVEETVVRPYALHTVGIGDYGSGRTMQAYSNRDDDQFEWPVFTCDQVAGLLAATDRSHFQPVWIEEIGTYAIVTGYGNSLEEAFDVGPYMKQVLQMEEVDDYQEGEGFAISYAEKYMIEVDGEAIEAFSFHPADYDFYRADDLVPAAAL